jgi:hypothetical protein
LASRLTGNSNRLFYCPELQRHVDGRALIDGQIDAGNLGALEAR